MKVILAVFFLAFSSCQTTGYFITDSPLQLPEIRKAVNAVIGKPRQVSLNGREMVSEYHNAKFESVEEAGKKERYQTKVVILEPRRPYEINVIVDHLIYDFEKNGYVAIEVDESLSRQRAVVIKKALNLSLDKQSGFDGDKPF